MTDMAFADLYREHYPHVIRLAQVMIGDSDIAKDVAQDVFIAVLRGLKEFRGESTLQTWVYRITLRTCGRHLAKRKKHAGVAIDLDTFPAMASAESAASAAELLTALSRLSIASRTILTLVAVEGLSNEAAAEILSIPVGTVWSRLNTARQQLASLLKLPDIG
jgi:RNA polymerase sigma-70 factor (ECF subfamily)